MRFFLGLLIINDKIEG